VKTTRTGQLAHGPFRQRRQHDPAHLRTTSQIPKQKPEPRVHRNLVIAVGDNQTDPRTLRAAGEDPHHIERQRIRPVSVLHHGHGRPAREEPLGQHEPILTSDHSRVTSGHRQQLANRGKRNRHRQRLAPANPDRHTSAHALPQRAHQRGLASARLTTDEHDPAVADKDAVDDPGQHPKLFIALEQALHPTRC
jgi:hypothetical protein